MNTLFSVLVLIGFLGLFVYLMYKIFKNTVASSPSALPPFDDTPSVAQTAELTAIKSFPIGTGITTTTNALPLRDLVIKSSFNSAFTGHYVNLNMIKRVLSRGARFLDFQIFVKDGFVVVGYSSATYDPSFTAMTSLNCVSLAGVCSTIMANAFSDTSPNKSDPLFVHFQLKTALSYDSVASVLSTNLKDKMFWNTDSDKAQQVTPDTLLGDLMGKVVVLINAPAAESDDLARVANMMTGTTNVPIYTEPQITTQMFTPSTAAPYLFRIVKPGAGFYGGVSNPDSYSLINHYATQVVCEAFYVNDTNLTNYEALFEKRKSAFLSLSDTIGYIKQKPI